MLYLFFIYLCIHLIDYVYTPPRDILLQTNNAKVELLRESKLAFKEGAEGGCVPSMFRYGTLLEVGVEDDKVHLAVPWYVCPNVHTT